MNRPVKVVLELRPEGAHVTGVARDAAGAERAFSGWLGLLAVLEALLSEKGAKS